MRLLGGVRLLPAVAVLVLAVTLPARAQNLPTGFSAKDIGKPGAVGSSVVDDKGVWTVQGAGADLWGKNNDDFQFAYAPVDGDGSIAATMIAAEGGHAEWVKTGVMIRENDARDSPHAIMEQTSGHGARFHWRPGKNKDSADVGTDVPYKFPIGLMVQRQGDLFAGYTSPDGKLWTLHGTVTIPMPTTALFGLAVMSHVTGKLMTVKFENVAVRPGITTITGARSAATDKLVLATWNAVPNAIGYRLYRGADAANLIPASAIPQIEPFLFEAAAGGLSTIVYAAAPVFKAADGSFVEGPAVRLR